jgi:hypothetical protein
LKPYESAPAKARPQKGFGAAEEATRACYGDLGAPTASWSYHDAEGNEVGRIVRWDPADGKKEVRPISLIDGQWSPAAMPSPRPLYRLPEVLEAETLWVCEGEKATDFVRECGLAATTSAGGSSGANQSDWTPLKGKLVVILQDNDEAGAKYPKEVERQAKKAGATEVITLDFTDRFPEFPEKGDAEQALKLVDGDHERLAALLDDMLREAREIAAHDAAIERERVEEMLFRPFPTEALPYPFNELAVQSAKSLGCDPALIALPTLAALAAAVGNTREVELKRGWREPCVLWCVIISESGTKKSPALRMALDPIKTLECEAMREWEAGASRRRSARAEYARRFTRWKKDEKNGPPPDEPPEEHARRYSTGDPTVESLAPLLKHEPRGLLLHRDEFSGWLASHDAYKKSSGGDVSHWLEMHGAEPMNFDRKGSGNTFVPRAAVCLAGGIQPGVFRRALGQENRENGLAARLFFAAPPDIYRPATDFEVSPDVLEAVLDVYRELCKRHVPEGDNGPKPRVVRLDAEARVLWNSFLAEHQPIQADLHGDIKAAWAKLEGGTARMGLVIHEARIAADVDPPENPDLIDMRSLSCAIEITRFFKHEAGRFYAESGRVAEAEGKARLAARARKIQVIFGGACTGREWRQTNSRRSTAESRAELQELVDAGLAKWEHRSSGPQGGRPSEKCVLTENLGDVQPETSSCGTDAEGFEMQSAEGSEPRNGKQLETLRIPQWRTSRRDPLSCGCFLG